MKIFFDNYLIEYCEGLLIEEGISFGYGLFETIKIYHGKPILLNEHLIRLMKSADYFAINIPEEKEMIERTNAIIKENKMVFGALKIKILKGKKQDHIILSTDHRDYAQNFYSQGVSLTMASNRKNEHSVLTLHKTLNYMENLHGKREAEKAGFFDSLFLNSKGHIAETSLANIFFIKGGKVFTPDLASGVLPGIIREQVIKIAGELSIPCFQGEFEMDFIEEIDAAFITNSLMGMMPINVINLRKLDVNNNIIQELNDIYIKNILRG